MTLVGDLAELERLAEKRLGTISFQYVRGGAGDSVTANIRGWQAVRLRPRVLRNVKTISTATWNLGRPSPSPILIAPTAMHRLACPEGELATAKAAARAGVIYIVSAMATTSIEDITAASPEGRRWMQAYPHKDPGRTRAMVERAAQSGCDAVVLTVDSPGMPHVRTDLSRPLNDGLPLPNLFPDVAAPDVLALASEYTRDLTFADLAGIRNWTGLPLVVKGVLRGDDARRCADHGADAVVVSNHGGRQVAGCVPTAVALNDVVAALGGQCEVYVDGGIRSGGDVTKALALGATGVLVGRPVWWGLAIEGEAGAFAVLHTLRTQLERTMALCGVSGVDDLADDLVISVPGISGDAPGT